MFQGTGDGQFLALDARTGATLWSTDNQAATLAGPISYEIGGEQYVAVVGGYGGSFFLIEGFVAASEGHALNGRVYVFKLGGTAIRPALTLQKTPPSSLARASPSSSLRSKMATLTPSVARRRAVAAPRPEAPPVTTAEMEESSFMGPVLCVNGRHLSDLSLGKASGGDLRTV